MFTNSEIKQLEDIVKKGYIELGQQSLVIKTIREFIELQRQLPYVGKIKVEMIDPRRTKKL